MTLKSNDQQICCATYRVGDAEIKAYLLERCEGVLQRYHLLLEQGDECVACELGTELLVARRLFFDVVFGGVTACTLPDVVEDAMAAGI